MKYINKFETTEAFEAAKEQLQALEHYTVYNVADTKVYLKPKESYFIINVKDADFSTPYIDDGTEIEIYENVDESDNPQIQLHVLPITVNENIKCIGFPYGFRFLSDDDFIATSVPSANADLSLNSIDLTNYDSTKIKNAYGMFGGLNVGKDTKVELIGINKLDVSNIVNMERMFISSNISSLDLSAWDVSNVTNMYGMFAYCGNLTSLDLSSFDTSNVSNMYGMFYYCGNLTSLDLSSFNTSNVTTMYGMFCHCTNLTSLDLSNFDTTNVSSMGYMFSGCYDLTSLDLSNFDTTNVSNMWNMFSGCSSLNHIRCKQTFKEWCIKKQNLMELPTAMREGGSGTWEIVN